MEYVDLQKRQNIAEDQIVVRFNFASGLVYPFQPARMWVSPILGGYEAREPQHEVLPTPNFLPGKLSQLSTVTITVKDKKSLELVEMGRQGKLSKIGLKVEMELRPGQSPVPFRPYSY